MTGDRRMHPLTTCDRVKIQTREPWGLEIMDNSAEDTTDDSTNSTFVVDLIKSNYYRVIHADGVAGSETPSGMIHLDFSNEREAIPRRITYTFDAKDELLDAQPESDSDFVREVEIAVVMSRDTAILVRDQLNALLGDGDAESESSPGSSES